LGRSLLRLLGLRLGRPLRWLLRLRLDRSLRVLLHLRLGHSLRGLLHLRLDAAGLLSVATARLRRWSALSRGCALLDRRRPADGALVSLRGGCGRTLRSLRLIALLHYGVLGLVSVVLALKDRLLLRARISIP
jgi:hypothetical protein